MKNNKELRKEKGSISVFVLLSLLFFLVITVSVTVFYVNKQTSMESKIKQISMSYKEKEPYEPEAEPEGKLSETESFVGYYADIDDDGEVDGIIYADLAFEISRQQWANQWGEYSYSAISNLKKYTISTITYGGQTMAGIYKANDGFGEKQVIVLAGNSTGNDRFYVMALNDFINDEKNRFYWYYNAYGNLSRRIQYDFNDFGDGKDNTIKMLKDWNDNTATYGEQTIASSGKDYIDLWGAIQNRQYDLVQSKENSKKWFIPSKGEWSAFGGNLGITTSNYVDLGLSDWYWSSSQYDVNNAYTAGFCYGNMSDGNVNDYYRGFVRLSTTF